MTDHHQHGKPVLPLPPREDQLSDIALAAAKEAARQTVSQLFSDLGINVANSDRVQELREDIAWVHRLRTGSKTAGTRFMMTLITVIAGAIAVSAWEFVKAASAYVMHALHVPH